MYQCWVLKPQPHSASRSKNQIKIVRRILIFFCVYWDVPGQPDPPEQMTCSAHAFSWQRNIWHRIMNLVLPPSSVSTWDAPTRQTSAVSRCRNNKPRLKLSFYCNCRKCPHTHKHTISASTPRGLFKGCVWLTVLLLIVKHKQVFLISLLVNMHTCSAVRQLHSRDNCGLQQLDDQFNIHACEY